MRCVVIDIRPKRFYVWDEVNVGATRLRTIIPNIREQRQNMTRMVQCVKLGRELPGLLSPPVAGELGQRVYENVSQEGWNLWLQHLTILINHYGINPMDPQATAFIMDQMEEFFFGDDAAMPDGWTPQGPGGKGGAPARK